MVVFRGNLETVRPMYAFIRSIIDMIPGAIEMQRASGAFQLIFRDSGHLILRGRPQFSLKHR